MILKYAFLLLSLTVALSRACLLPPKGCSPSACDNLWDMVVPANYGDFSRPSTWQGIYGKLAFIRSSFNKNLGPRGPSEFTPQSWLDLLKGYDGYGTGQYVGAGGPPNLPSVNYEFYDLGGSTVKTDAPATVEGPDNKKYTPGASLYECCHACRVTDGCPMYAFLPFGKENELTSVAGGKCFFVKSGANTRDGPYDYENPKNEFSPRTKLITSPAALTRDETTYKLRNPSLFPTHFQVFLGGYCNPHTYPNGTVTDDPHFTGAQGTRFDFNGELDKTYCLMTDRTLHINALLKGYKSENAFRGTKTEDGKTIRSWIRELGILWTDGRGKSHRLQLVARSGKQQERGNGFLSSASLDGTPMQVPEQKGSSFKSGDLTFTFYGTRDKGWYQVDHFQLVIGGQLDLSFQMRKAHPKLQSPDDAQVHFNLMMNSIKVSERVHGVLGQTYRKTPAQLKKAIKFQMISKLLGGPVQADGKSGAGFLEGSTGDYEASGVLAADCKVSSFGQ